MSERLSVVPLELREANELITNLHRHHKKVQGHRFSIGCVTEDGVLHGACVVGRPVARMTNPKEVLEVTRLVTDGTKNACSCLYAAASRIGREMGYRKIQTFILDNESGVSLKGAGWICEDSCCGGGQWVHTDGKPRREDQPTCKKQRWCKHL